MSQQNPPKPSVPAFTPTKPVFPRPPAAPGNQPLVTPPSPGKPEPTQPSHTR